MVSAQASIASIWSLWRCVREHAKRVRKRVYTGFLVKHESTSTSGEYSVQIVFNPVENFPGISTVRRNYAECLNKTQYVASNRNSSREVV